MKKQPEEKDSSTPKSPANDQLIKKRPQPMVSPVTDPAVKHQGDPDQLNEGYLKDGAAFAADPAEEMPAEPHTHRVITPTASASTDTSPIG